MYLSEGLMLAQDMSLSDTVNSRDCLIADTLEMFLQLRPLYLRMRTSVQPA